MTCSAWERCTRNPGPDCGRHGHPPCHLSICGDAFYFDSAVGDDEIAAWHAILHPSAKEEGR